MRKLLGSTLIAALLLAATHWSYSVSGWLFWGLLPALWLDRQFLQTLPWRERRPLVPAALLRLFYVGLGCALVLPYYPRVPFEEALVVGLTMSSLAFGFELLVGLLNGKSSCRYRLAALVPALLLPLLVLLPLKSFHQFHTQPLKTPADHGLIFEEVTLAADDGQRLAAWYVPHSQPKGGVIFCHGHGGNRQHVLWTLTTMHELGLAVVAFDFRGHGDSPGHTSTFGHREVADVVAAEAFLAQQLPGQPLFLAGISYGGAVSLQALPHLPRIRAAWIDSSFARLTDVADNRFRHFPGPARQGLIRLYSNVLWLDCGFWGPDINPIDCLPNIEVPIHFAHGTDDNLIPFHQGQSMYDRYAGPKQCFWMEGATHFVRSAEVSTEYVRRFKEFFRSQLAAE
jgi:alpha-beta hydrolase superfamily lysophospholipase